MKNIKLQSKVYQEAWRRKAGVHIDEKKQDKILKEIEKQNKLEEQ